MAKRETINAILALYKKLGGTSVSRFINKSSLYFALSGNFSIDKD